jgi:hypothetical protein
VGAALAAAVAIVGLIGHIVGATRLHTPVPGGGEISVESAFALALLALGVAASTRWVRLVALAGTLVLAATSFAEYLGAPGPHSGPAARMPLATAVAMLLLTLAVLARSPLVGQLSAILGAAVGGLVLVGFSFGTRTLTRFSDSAMSVPAAIAVVMLAFAILSAVPDGWYQWVTRGADAGAMALRRTLPPLVLGLPAITFLHMQGERRFWNDERVSEAGFATLVVLLMSALLFRVASSLRALDLQRDQARRDLVALNAHLMTDVRASYASLQSAQQRIGSLKDSQRAVLTVHDDVLQTIYASGLMLRTHAAPEAPSVQRTLECLDDAIKAIRRVVEDLNSELGAED